MMPTPRSRHPRRPWRRLAALASCALVVVAILVVLPAPRASAVTHTFLVNSLSLQGDDVSPGNGVCLTATGVCTLRAALQESNALAFPDVAVIAPAEDVDASTPGVQSSGTIVGSGSGAANWMFVGTLTPWGDGGALFMATRSVVLDFQNRLGIASLNDSNGVTALYVNGPDVTVRNFSSVKSNETAFVLGPNSDRAVIENGSCTDPGSVLLERCFWLANGADEVTLRSVQMGSTSTSGGSAIRIADAASITGLTLDRIRMYDPDTEAYIGVQMEGTATLTRLTITGSTFEGFQAQTWALDLRGATLTNAVISGNRFARMNNTATYTTLWISRPGTNNVISGNTFANTATDVGGYGVYFSSLGLSATTNSGWTVRDNYFNGRRSNSVWIGTGSGIVHVERNTFGPDSFGGGASANETNSTSLVYNESTTANQKINTWYPTSVAYDGADCTLDVGVVPPVTAPVPVVAVTIDVYYTATTKAEVFLGRQTGLISAGTVTVPYTLGPGNIRVQTTAANGSVSQYSRTIAQSQADVCGPRVTIDQAPGQADPTSIRDVRFVAQFSETVTADLLPAAVSTAGSTAPGATVTGVTRLSGSSFAITARANGTGTVVLSLPAGAITDPAGNASLASTSTDNEVTYVSPLSVAPAAVTVEEGGSVQTYTVTSTVAATAPVTVTPTVGDPAWATVAPSPLVIPTTVSTGVFSVQAVDDLLVNGTRTTSVTHTVTSPDPNFDGLLLPAVGVQVLDNDHPDTGQSHFNVTQGSRIADGTDFHQAVVVVENASGQLLPGVLVTFQVSGGATLGSESCVSGANGACAVTVTSTVAGSSIVRAFIGGIDEIPPINSNATFVAGPPSTTMSSIASSVLSLPADGESTATITVTLRDAQGNPVGTGGADVVVVTTAGTLTSPVDHGDGTYTATLTAPTVAGTATVGYTLAGTPGADTVTINVVPGEPSPSTSTIEAAPTTLPADGTSTSTVTVRLVDGYGNPVVAGGAGVVVLTTAGTVTAPVDHGDGTYTATLTAPTLAGTATLRFTIEGVVATATATVAFVPGSPSAATSEIAASPTAVTADGVSQSAVTVTLRDANGNRLTGGGQDVGILTSLGTVTAAADNGDGTFTAALTAPASPGTATLSFTVGGTPGTATAAVHFLAGAPDPVSSLVTADPTSITADGVATSTVTVTVRDAQGSVLTEGGADVHVLASAGTLGPVTDHLDGTYTADLTSDTAVGEATVTFTVGGVASPNIATVAFVAGPADPARATISAAPPTVPADGSATSTVTVQLVDAHGNPVDPATADVQFSTTLGSLGTATSTPSSISTHLSSSAAGTATVSFTVDGVPAPATADVAFLPGAGDATTSTIDASPTAIVADAVSSSVVTVTVRDANGNQLVAGGGVVTMSSDLGTLSNPTDNGDGTWTSVLTSVTTGTATVGFTVDGTPSPDTTVVEVVPGPPDPEASTITAAPATVSADGVAVSVVTVTLRDAQGNLAGNQGEEVGILADFGDQFFVLDNGDGTWTTEVSSTVAGRSTVSFDIDGVPATATATIDFVAGPADAGASTVVVDPATVAADGTTSSTVTVTLRDAQGNPTGLGGVPVTMSSDLGTLTSPVDHGDGTWTAQLTSTAAGTATVRFTVDGEDAVATATVDFLAGVADAEASTVVADPATATADGTDAVTVTVTVLDANGNPVGDTADVVTMSSDLGTLTSPVDHGDGTWTAQLTSTVAGTATVSFTVNGATGGATAPVAFTTGPADVTTSDIDASPAQIVADGAATSLVTVRLRDARGNALVAGGDTVTTNTTLGLLTPVTDNGDGTYTATLTSGTVPGVATVSFTVNGAGAPATTAVVFLAGPADAGNSLIAADRATATADGSDATTITVTLLDANGNPTGLGGVPVTMDSDLGTLTAPVDHGDGTYSAVLTSTAVGTATVSFAVAGDPGTATAVVAFVAGVVDPGSSTIVAVPPTIVADGAEASTVTVTLRDSQGNAVTTGAAVVLATTSGTLTTPVDQGDGTWTAQLTTTVAGPATIGFTVNGDAATGTAVVQAVAGVADPGRSTIATDPGALEADGASTAIVTVTLLDAQGNLLGRGGDAVTMDSTAGELSGVTDRGDGTYTAVLTAPTTTTPPTASITFTVNAVVGADTATVAFEAGVASGDASEIVAAPSSVTADGTTASTVTVTLRDGQGNPVTDAGAVVGLTTTQGTLSTVTDHGDGTYTATLTSTVTGTATVGFTVFGAGAGPTATVTFTPGPADAGSSTVTAAPSQIVADGASTSAVTVRLRDAFGNPLASGGATVVIDATAGTLGAVADHGDGTYTALLTSATTPGSSTVSFTVDGAASTATTTVQFAEIPPSPSTSTIDATPTTIGSDGVESSQVVVILRDAGGLPIAHGGAVVAMSSTLGTLTSVVDQGDGTYTASLTSTVAGVASIGFTVDGMPGAATTAVTVLDTVVPAAPVITHPTDGELVRPDVAIVGTGEPGAFVAVTAAGELVCFASVTTSGTWSCVPDAPLPAGTTTLTAVQTDAADNASSESDPVTVTVDSTVPPAPVPDPTNGARITGRSEPGTTVTVRDEGGTVLCVTTTDGEGRFECVPSTAIPQGTLLSLTATDEAGNESSATRVRVGGPTVTLTLATATHGEVQTANGSGFLPGETVSGLLESTPVDLGTLTVDTAGTVTFTVTLPADIEAGTHRITLTGTESGATVAEFRVESAAPAAPSPPSASSSPALPWTGGVGLPAAAGAALLLLVLGALMRRPLGRHAGDARRRSARL